MITFTRKVVYSPLSKIVHILIVMLKIVSEVDNHVISCLFFLTIGLTTFLACDIMDFSYFLNPLDLWNLEIKLFGLDLFKDALSLNGIMFLLCLTILI